MKQLVWVCDRYELADDNNSEVPNWPVQDEGAIGIVKNFLGNAWLMTAPM